MTAKTRFEKVSLDELKKILPEQLAKGNSPDGNKTRARRPKQARANSKPSAKSPRR